MKVWAVVGLFLPRTFAFASTACRRCLSPSSVKQIPTTIAMASSSDPFDVFGSDNDNDKDDNDDDGQELGSSTTTTTTTTTTGANTMVVRDASCGPLAFHRGTEISLLHYVRQGLEEKATTVATSVEASKGVVVEDISHGLTRMGRILELVDAFCYSRHWMMHIGPEKGLIMEKHLTDCIQHYQRMATSSTSTTALPQPPFVIVEVGTYCGYSLIRMARQALQHFGTTTKTTAAGTTTTGSEHKLFHIFTVDVNPENVAVAQQMIALAGLQDHVTFIVLQDPVNIVNELSDTVRSRIEASSSSLLNQIGEKNEPASTRSGIDFLFLDHAKELYLADLQQLERSGLLKARTYVAADNILFFRLDEYREHMRKRADEGIVETRLEVGHLEYVDPNDEADKDLRDGLGTTPDLNVCLCARFVCSCTSSISSFSSSHTASLSSLTT
jgi:catechol O-methyltransferase